MNPILWGAVRKLLVGLLILGAALPAPAATITVNNISGAHNVVGSCVLRDAITAANTHAVVGGCGAGSGSGTNVIELPGGGVTISLTAADNTDFTNGSGYGANGLPIVVTPIAIHGNGATIERSTTVACNADGAYQSGEFRLLYVAVGGSLEIDDADLANGCADTISPAGGAIAGGIEVVADAATTVLFRHVRLSNNYAYLGGSAIAQDHGSLHIEYSTIDNNRTGSFGLTILVSDINNVNTCLSNLVEFRLFNSTISDNAAGTLPTILGCGTARIEASTITANLGSPALRWRAQTGSIGAIQIKNSIVADNPVGNCDLPNDTTLSVSGTNLSSDTSCPNFTYTSTPGKLAPLADYGGPTPTHSPLPGSLAIDAVTDCKRVDNATVVTDDQRGTSRPLQGAPADPVRCDIGAVEYDGDLIFANGFD